MADGVELGINLEQAAVDRLFAVLPPAIQNRLSQLVEGAAIDVQRTMRIKAPAAVTGRLRNSITYSFSRSTLTAEVSPTADYAEDVEKGTPPHWVSAAPDSPLARWANLKGINPYALRNAIAKRGTKPHPFVEPTHDEMEPKVLRSISDGLSQLTREANDGRI